MGDKFIITFYLLIALLGFGFIFGGITIGYTNNEVIEITIKDKYVKNGSKSGKYLIVDSNNNAYQVTDLFFKGKFNSTDIYNQLEIGKTYRVEISGKRIHIFSMYQNINKIIEEE